MENDRQRTRNSILIEPVGIEITTTTFSQLRAMKILIEPVGIEMIYSIRN